MILRDSRGKWSHCENRSVLISFTAQNVDNVRPSNNEKEKTYNVLSFVFANVSRHSLLVHFVIVHDFFA